MTTEGGTTQDVLGSARNPARVCSRAALGAHRGSEEIARCVSSSFPEGAGGVRFRCKTINGTSAPTRGRKGHRVSVTQGLG